MSLSAQIAKQFRQVFFGGNWTAVNLTDTLNGVDWNQATRKLHSFNTIAVLVFHINYYIKIVSKVLQGGPLDGHDKLSFDLPPIHSEEDWNKLLEETWADAKHFATLVEELPDTKLDETFTAEKYGSYYRNLQGIIEHTHYHLGQIVLLKKLLSETA
ncbi:MAG: DinB family protein [Flavisolibacter sp.]